MKRSLVKLVKDGLVKKVSNRYVTAVAPKSRFNASVASAELVDEVNCTGDSSVDRRHRRA
jgi:23S rRNA G2445 N2-methylase RlmL